MIKISHISYIDTITRVYLIDEFADYSNGIFIIDDYIEFTWQKYTLCDKNY